jgi:hypothetical protein
MLTNISALTHRPFAEIIDTLPDNVVTPALTYPGFKEIIDLDSIEDCSLRDVLEKRCPAMISQRVS